MTLRIGVFGAGAIGCFLGIRLSAAGAAVTLLGRSRLVDNAGRIQAEPLGAAPVKPAEDCVVTADPAALAACEVCLVTVKSGGTAAAAETLASVLPPDCLVVSMQNGLRNPEVLRAQLGDRVVAGMVSYNVLSQDGHRYVQATRGPLLAGHGRGPAAARMPALVAAMRAAAQTLTLHANMPGVAAGKLLLNLNNGVCAATGLTILDSLRNRDARWCFAACMREGLAALRAAAIRPERVLALPPWAIARLLPLPDAIVLRVARRMIDVDPSARSSTLQDVLAGRSTEIDDLNGAIVDMARAHEVPAPANAEITARVRGFAGQSRPAFVDPAVLRQRIAAAS